MSKRPKLPEEALAQLRGVLDNYDRLRAEATSPHAGDDQEVSRIRHLLEAQPDDVWWTDIATAQLCVVDLLSGDQIGARIGGWRRRLHEVIGDQRYAEYLKNAPDLSKPQEPEALKADLCECIATVYYFYSAYGISARSRADVSRALLRSAGLIIAIEALAIVLLLASVFLGSSQGGLFHNAVASASATPAGQQAASVPAKGNSTSPPTPQKPSEPPDWRFLIAWILAASAAAVAGCAVSVQRRLQDPTLQVDPLYRYIQTEADQFSIAVTNPIFAAFFGAIMYGLLASQLITTSLAKLPNCVPDGCAAAAIVLILAFASGFAEQLIPDALTRLSNAVAGAVPTQFSSGSKGEQAPPSGTATQRQQQIDAAAKPPTPQPTGEAAALGHDASVASGPDPSNLDKGTT